MVRILQCGNAPAAPATRPRFLTRTAEEVRISFLPLNLRLQHPTLPVSTALQDARISLHDSRSEEHTSELQSQSNLVCRLLLEKKKNNTYTSSVKSARNIHMSQ